MRFAENPLQPVSELMTVDNLATVPLGTGQEEARRLLHQRRIEKLLVVDDNGRCVGLITVKDIEKAVAYPDARGSEGVGQLVGPIAGLAQGLTTGAVVGGGNDLFVRCDDRAAIEQLCHQERSVLHRHAGGASTSRFGDERTNGERNEDAGGTEAGRRVAGMRARDFALERLVRATERDDGWGLSLAGDACPVFALGA